MTALAWDQPGERTYQSGVDRGVLYLMDGRSVPWNGLTGVEDSTSKETASYYIDGVKYLEYNSPGDYSGILKAYTYPDEFNDANGVLKYIPGLHVHDQASKAFNLSYRTKIGDDVDGIDAGYIIHLIYNVLANPDSSDFETLGSEIKPTEFSWTLTAKPIRSGLWLPTAHLSIESRELSLATLQGFEDIIYGNTDTDPHFPTIEEVVSILTPSDE